MDIEKYFSSFFGGTKDPSLKAMQYFMEQFRHPEREYKIIHIAGTNGKGSCTEMMSNILIKAGYRVGKFMSPHLVKCNERFCIQNEPITDKSLEELITKIQPYVDAYNSENTENVTLFELETTIALLYFAENNCDFVVLETGLGGMFDCTNIVSSMISMITSIGYDHMNLLGNTLEEIAEQKAGIIKQNADTVYALSEENTVNEVIKNVCQKNNNQLHAVNQKDITNVCYDNDFQTFDYKNYAKLKTNLKGKKQIINSCLCIECVEILRKKGYPISDETVRCSLQTVVHKGRFEVVCENPLMIFDGAHNKPAIENFKKSYEMYYPNQNKIFIISILKTKDAKTILQELLEEDGIFIVTNGNRNEVYRPKEELLEIAKRCTKNKKIYALEIEDAIDWVKENAKDEVTFFVGSFYVYGQVIKKIEEKKND